LPKIRGVEFTEGGSHLDGQIIDVSCNLTKEHKIIDNYVNNKGYDTDDSIKY